MTTEEFKNLGTGDLVRHKTADHSCIVTANYGKRVTAVRTFELTNPAEWDLIHKSGHGEKVDTAA